MTSEVELSLDLDKGKGSFERRDLLRSSGSGFVSDGIIRSGSSEFSSASETLSKDYNSIPNRKWWRVSDDLILTNWKEITKYQWLVLSACWLGWLFDVLGSFIS